jgi:hypothetical protein
MDFSHIKDYLEKFKIILKQKDDNIDLIINVIYQHINFKFNKNNIIIKNNIVFIKSSPIIRNEIFLKKGEILNSFKEKSIFLKDIR